MLVKLKQKIQLKITQKVNLHLPSPVTRSDPRTGQPGDSGASPEIQVISFSALASRHTGFCPVARPPVVTSRLQLFLMPHPHTPLSKVCLRENTPSLGLLWTGELAQQSPEDCSLHPTAQSWGTRLFLKLMALELGRGPEAPSASRCAESEPGFPVRQEQLCSGAPWNMAISQARAMPSGQHTSPSSPQTTAACPFTWGIPAPPAPTPQTLADLWAEH